MRGTAIDSNRGVKILCISQNWVKVLGIFHNLWVQLSLSQKSRGQFDPLHPSNGALELGQLFFNPSDFLYDKIMDMKMKGLDT